MRQPEMSHSPAYYQQSGQLVTAYPRDLSTSAAHLPPDSSLNRHQHHHHDDSSHRPLPGLSSVRDSDTRPNSGAVPSRHSRHPPQTPAESYRPESEQSVAVPVTSVISSPHFENGSILTWGSNSSGAARKEERIRGSLTDHSSYMSGDNHPHSVSRVQKRTIQDDDLLEDDNQDALLMLFRLSIPVPLFSLCASLYTIFGLLFVILVSPLRLCSCIPYLRSNSFRTQLCDLFAPPLHVHERLVCLRQSNSFRSSSSQWIYNDPDRSSPSDPSDDYSIGGLIAVLLLSSLLSIAFVLLVWTAASFWVFAMILGNPDGTERKDDGRAAVLGVSRWWQRWLGKARKLSS
ncbi:hypothetical protein ASPWEDRAFT_175601 [Aspergillus wentii DTO 134E9]|uniref:Uncharacterized protein n=1 Tax=Aspergillus wentii DTO 134E9 TaxID=1073089 RepID=A0A1L9RBR8_ASPWE|nr:uncharacterized protein ASPWEDRAFT_175601 [Aspergillus wentii DTO 134E9]KAI9934876.1 hypothetical protein MW887_000497 [Aspergillus wentii]OJJ32317.1 hypothetical protein ASPWEDRAFT_175601 [Aspergillus wentii DTO 134E9]